jgi:hypothetical protein
VFLVIYVDGSAVTVHEYFQVEVISRTFNGSVAAILSYRPNVASWVDITNGVMGYSSSITPA